MPPPSRGRCRSRFSESGGCVSYGDAVAPPTTSCGAPHGWRWSARTEFHLAAQPTSPLRRQAWPAPSERHLCDHAHSHSTRSVPSLGHFLSVAVRLSPAGRVIEALARWAGRRISRKSPAIAPCADQCGVAIASGTAVCAGVPAVVAETGAGLPSKSKSTSLLRTRP